MTDSANFTASSSEDETELLNFSRSFLIPFYTACSPIIVFCNIHISFPKDFFLETTALPKFTNSKLSAGTTTWDIGYLPQKRPPVLSQLCLDSRFFLSLAVVCSNCNSRSSISGGSTTTPLLPGDRTETPPSLHWSYSQLLILTTFILQAHLALRPETSTLWRHPTFTFLLVRGVGASIFAMF